MKKLLAILSILLVLTTTGVLSASEDQPTPAEVAVKKLADKLRDKITQVSPQGAVVAVVRFLNLGTKAINKKMGEIVTELLTAELSNSPKIKLVEREDLDKLLQELRLSLLGVTNPRLASRIGKMLNAQFMIIGAVSDVGTEFIINARIVDVATSRIIGGVGVRLRQQDVIALSSKYLVVKTKAGALYRSLIIPGWGQIYSGHTVKGVFYTVTTLGLVGAALTEYYIGKNVYYDDKYMNATNPDDAKYYYDKAVSAYKLGNQLMLAGAALWVVNVVDAYVTGINASEVKTVKTVFISPMREGVYLGFNYSF